MPEPKSASGRSMPGFVENASGWLGAMVEYARVRMELAGIEGREAALHYGVLLVLAFVGLVFLVFGYLFFCLALVFSVAVLLGDGNAWIWVTFGMAALHGGAGLGAMVWIKLRIVKPMFSVTLDELRKDQEWLTSTSGNLR